MEYAAKCTICFYRTWRVNVKRCSYFDKIDIILKGLLRLMKT